MPQQKPGSLRIKLVAPKLLGRSLRIGGTRGTRTKQVPLVLPAMMVIESANRFLSDRRSFGNKKDSFDQAVAPFFRLAFDNAARVEAFRSGYDVYGKVADAISTKAKVKTKKLRTYCAMEVARGSLQSVLQTLAAEEQIKNFGMADLAKIIETYTEPWGIQSNRTVTASVDLIQCKDPEEEQMPDKVTVCADLGPFGRYCQTVTNPLYGPNSGDEIYVTSFGAIFSVDGYKVRRSLVSGVFPNIGTVSGHHSSFPPGVARFPLQDVLNRSSDTRVYYAYYSFTVFEYEHSEEERRKALAQAALDATEAVIALLQQDWIGFGINIAQLLYDLAVALDDDDCLGSVGIRYDDIGRLPSVSLSNTFTFDDTHLLNHYRYEVQTGFKIEA